MDRSDSKALNKTPGAEYWPKFLDQDEADIVRLLSGKGIAADDKKALFKKFVCIINVETSTYCNRKCSYCPDAIYDRTKQQHIDEASWTRLISELSSIEYGSTISLNLYNEPMADRTLVDKIRFVRRSLPAAFIKFNSNGDYLDEQKLEEMALAGVDAIFVTLHQGPKASYEDAGRLAHFQKFFRRIGRTAECHVEAGVKIRAELFHRNMRLLIMADNWLQYGNDRSGVVGDLSTEGRTTPCVRPFREFTVGHDGHVYPCCQFFPDSESNHMHRLGHVGQTSIFDIYASELLSAYRRDLFGFNEKKSPCDSCADPDNAATASESIRARLVDLAAQNDR